MIKLSDAYLFIKKKKIKKRERKKKKSIPGIRFPNQQQENSKHEVGIQIELFLFPVTFFFFLILSHAEFLPIGKILCSERLLWLLSIHH